MTTANSRLIAVTDDAGRPCLPGDEMYEPLPASIVLTKGRFGSAWQRYFSDGLWYPVGGGKPRTWEQMCADRGVVIVYDAEERA